jgi:ferredoxin-NADP reductase
VNEPDGDFVIGDPADEHVLIAAGIGITPFRAILFDLDHRRLPSIRAMAPHLATPTFHISGPEPLVEAVVR